MRCCNIIGIRAKDALLPSVTVVGSSGFVGGMLARGLAGDGFDVVTAARVGADYEVDLASPEDFNFDEIAGSTVVMAAAVPSPAFCEERPDEAWAINVEGTCAFIERAIAVGCRVLFLSSDAVYASEPGEVYDEASPMSPRFAYGKMKAEVEKRFAGEGAFKALRLSYVCSRADKVTAYLLGCAAEGSRASVFHPYYRSCTTATDVLRATSWVVRNWSELPDSALNIAGTELVSRIRVADELRRNGVVLHYDIENPPDGFYSCRPEVTEMASRYLYELGIVERRPFSQAYAEELMEGDNI